MRRIAYIQASDRSLSLVADGQPLPPVAADHPNYRAIIAAIRDDNVEILQSLLDVPMAVAQASHGRIQLDAATGTVTYNGQPIHHVVAQRALEQLQAGLPVDSLLRFLDRLMQNPSRNAVQHLYTFLEHKGLPITEDGCFLAYKGVRADWTDRYTGTVDNSVGREPAMPRNEVDDTDVTQDCGHGYHAGTQEYARSYASNDGHIIIVKVPPEDVVRVTTGVAAQKCCTCHYWVVGEYTDLLDRSPVYRAEVGSIAPLPVAPPPEEVAAADVELADQRTCVLAAPAPAAPEAPATPSCPAFLFKLVPGSTADQWRHSSAGGWIHTCALTWVGEASKERVPRGCVVTRPSRMRSIRDFPSENSATYAMEVRAVMGTHHVAYPVVGSDDEVRFAIGCTAHTLEAWREQIHAIGRENDYCPRDCVTYLEYLEVLAEEHARVTAPPPVEPAPVAPEEPAASVAPAPAVPGAVAPPLYLFDLVPGSTADQWEQRPAGGWVYRPLDMPADYDVPARCVVTCDCCQAEVSWASSDLASLAAIAAPGTPLAVVAGSRHLAWIPVPGTLIRIGCQLHSLAYWRAHIYKVGQPRGYSLEQCDEYLRYVEVLAALAGLS